MAANKTGVKDAAYARLAQGRTPTARQSEALIREGVAIARNQARRYGITPAEFARRTIESQEVLRQGDLTWRAQQRSDRTNRAELRRAFRIANYSRRTRREILRRLGG